MNLTPYPNLLENAGLAADAVAGVDGRDGNTNVNVNSAVDVNRATILMRASNT